MWLSKLMTCPSSLPKKLQSHWPFSIPRSYQSFWMAQWVKNLPAMQETQIQVRSLGLEDPLEEEVATIPVFLPGKSHGQRSLVGYSSKGWTAKRWTWLSDWADIRRNPSKSKVFKKTTWNMDIHPLILMDFSINGSWLAYYVLRY